MKLQLFRLVSLVKLPLLFVGAAYISSLLILPSGVNAQKNITPSVDPTIIRVQPKIPITTGFERRFRTDIDDGGDLDEWRAVLGVSVGTNVGKQWRLGAGVNYLYNRYNFSGSSGFSGLDPWEDIHAISLSIPVMYRPTKRLRFIVAPSIGMHAEYGADYDRGLKGGGSVTGMYSFGRKLTLGLVGSASTQIENSPSFRIFPLLRWQITDRLVVGTQRNTLRGGGGGLTYTLGKGWKAKIGGSYNKQRFRLDDGGSAPDGVGERSSIPLWGSIVYAPSRAFKAELFGGASVFGHVRLEDEDGNKIRNKDVDPAPSLGLAITGSF